MGTNSKQNQPEANMAPLEEGLLNGEWLTHKAPRPHQFQSHLVGQDGRVAMGDVSRWAGVNKHGGPLRLGDEARAESNKNKTHEELWRQYTVGGWYRTQSSRPVWSGSDVVYLLQDQVLSDG